MDKIISEEKLREIENILESIYSYTWESKDLFKLIFTIRELKKTQITEAEKDALAFYGNPENYHNTEGDEWPSDVQMDEGETAREARNG